MNILSFGASSSSRSINKKLANYIAELIPDSEKRQLDLNDYPLPLYCIDYEAKNGIPDNAKSFYENMEWADVIVISFAEHNGTYTAVFKNIFDWVSRVKLKMFENKKLILLSTAPGARGGQTVLHAAIDRFPHHGAEIAGSLAFPFFTKNFSDEFGIIDEEIKSKVDSIIQSISTQNLHSNSG